MTRFEKFFMWLCILLTIVMLAFAAYKTFTPREIIKPIETDAPVAQAFKCEKTLSYFAPTAQLEAAWQRVYCIGKPAKATKAALMLSSGSGAYDAAIAQYKAFTGYTGLQDMGICTATGEENKSEAKLAEIRAFAQTL